MRKEFTFQNPFIQSNYGQKFICNHCEEVATLLVALLVFVVTLLLAV